ncbi:alpha/beta fold hydrolase [Embleya sp. NPDC050493]|uniref:alpha/beta fold hydrolase n=1 Tax=Embleya sp. NPDC050493 TaxID=3363989 RepID=UPI0037A617B4
MTPLPTMTQQPVTADGTLCAAPGNGVDVADDVGPRSSRRRCRAVPSGVGRPSRRPRAASRCCCRFSCRRSRNTARDMDVITAALGERRISYVGCSYGTHPGTAYARMFPGRVDRVVLGGALDPRRYGPGGSRGSENENDRAERSRGVRRADWAALRNDAYHLGGTRTEVAATVDRVQGASTRGPLVVGTAPDVYRPDDSHVGFVLLRENADDTDAARALSARMPGSTSTCPRADCRGCRGSTRPAFK